MGDVVGRLFREFAITLAVTILHLGGRLADPGADAVRAHAAPHAHGERRRLSSAATQAFDWLIASLRPLANWVLDHQPLTLLVAVGDPGADGRPLYLSSRRAFSRSRIPASSRASPRPRNRSPSTRWRSASRRWPMPSSRIPAVDSLSSFIGVDGTNATLNSGRFLINLEDPSRARRRQPAVIRRMQPRGRRCRRASRSTCSRSRT